MQASLAQSGWKEWDDLPPEVQAKVDPRILAELRGEVVPTHLLGSASGRGSKGDACVAPTKDRKPPDKTRFLVYLKAQTDLQAIQAQPFATLDQQRATVVDALIATAQATQGPVKTLLDTQKAAGTVSGYFPYYVFNGFAVEGGLDAVIELAKRDDVEHISANYPLVKFDQPAEGGLPYVPSGPAPAAAPRNVWATERGAELGRLHADNWNIDLVDAERVWSELGVDGSGAVVADFDTGVQWNHPALMSRYRGWNGTTADHNYNWFEFDPGNPANWDMEGNFGPSASNVPYDCDGHGTHTMGTMVGDGGTATTRIGMAPGAKWMATPGICWTTMPGGYADDIGGIRTFQWLICPTDLSGDLATRDCSKAPDVINNSWGSSNPADDTFRPIVQALRAAGIAPVFASGNPSAGLGSIGSPASIPEGIAVGATDIDDLVTSFSGRGPSFYEGVQKPELTAPGENVRSSIPTNSYDSYSGTSMAAPHVSGLIALMVSADLQDGQRDLNVDELLAFMEYTALDLGPSGPDDEYGYGRIDAYNAVRWVLGAGDLQGMVRDTDTLAPIDAATLTGIQAHSGDAFTTHTDASGTYSTTVPGGTYNVTIEAFGYLKGTFSGVSVITRTNTLLDFKLTPLPTALLTGQVLSGAMPVAGAEVYVDAKPSVAFTTGADGAYALTLPVGTHELTVEAVGYRIHHATVTVATGGSTHDFDITPAPTILLVEADGDEGWFFGRPARNFFQWSLDARDYLYDTYVITDTTVLPTLTGYDVVIWAHTAGSPGTGRYGTRGVLQDYLDDGGRLILSGQDIGQQDDLELQDRRFYYRYLHASCSMDVAAGLGDTVSGSGFLSGLNLTLNEAALYSYANTGLGLWPDGVTPRDGNAYSIMTYDNGNGTAALAVDPCEQPFRAVYLAVGYENLGPRAYSRPPEYADVLERSIQWVVGSKPAYDVAMAIAPDRQTAAPGTIVNYDLTVSNTGATADTYALSLSGNAWAARVLSGTTEVGQTVEIRPCSSQDLTVEVTLPGTASTGDEDTLTIIATSQADPTISASASTTTTAFPPWRIETPMPTPRYRLAAINLPGETYYYAIGGQGGSSWIDPIGANERYNACTGQWESMAPMPTPRGNIEAAAIADKIYVPGGYASENLLAVLEIYDPAADSWSSGAPLPEPLSGAAVAAYDGKLYVFGGSRPDSDYSNKTYEYDPTSDSWTEKTPMPGGGRAYGVATTLDGKVYVVGGWFVNTVEVYDPVTDSWSDAAPMNYARQSPGLVAAPDGYLYVSGGGDDEWNGLNSAERYNPATDTWQAIPPLNDASRAGSASAYAAGRVFAVGGVGNSLSSVNEALFVSDAFCLSDKSVEQNAIQPGGRVTYTVELRSDMATLPAASVADPIPVGTTFAGFGVNPVGATYNAGLNCVEWEGAIPSGSAPLAFTFGVDVNPGGWTSGDLVVNEATFDSGTGLVFTRTATTRLDFPDPSPSVKTVDRAWAMQGDTLVYTVHVENGSFISDVFTVVDPIPANASYVPDSLTYTLGIGSYDPLSDAVNWAGTLPEIDYPNTSDDYQWGDSDGAGAVPGVTFEWIDISGSGTNAGTGDDAYYCGLPIGFTLNFYGTEETTFCASTNGFVSFDTEGNSDLSSDCPLPSPNGNVALIAALWDDLVTDDGIYYQTFGMAPNRYLVVQWNTVHHYGDSTYFDFEVVLYENGILKVQILDAGPETGSGSTTGIENDDATRGATYACHTPGSIHHELAVAFVPPGGMIGISSADITFAVTTDTSLPINTWITNTATITGPLNTVQRSASTLINPVDLGTSFKKADKSEATLGERVTYSLYLENSGMLTASGATLTDPIPANTTYVPGSVGCSGGACSYDPVADAITWSGDIDPDNSVDLTFAVTLTTSLPDLTPVTNTAALSDGYGGLYDLEAAFLARSSELGNSFKQAIPALVDPGGTITYTIYVRNSGIADVSAEVRDELPAQLTYVPDSLTCGTGSCSYSLGAVTWTGTAHAQSMVPVRFQATASAGTHLGDEIVNTAVVTDLTTMSAYPIAATVRVSGTLDHWNLYMPILYSKVP